MQKFANLTMALLFSAGVSVIANPHAAESETVSNLVSSAADTQKSKGLQFAQRSSGACQKVLARNGLYVRIAPTINSRVAGAIQFGRNVTVESSESTQQWARISAPLAGYVWADWLGPCESAAYAPPPNCRRVVARSGAAIRQSPGTGSAILGEVASGRRVTIENRGVNGWVPISVPLKGYISSSTLANCVPPFAY